MALTLRPIDRTNANQLWDIIFANPVRHCFVASKLEAYVRSGFVHRLGDIVGVFQGDELISAFHMGANVVPVNASEEAIDLFAHSLISQGRRCSSIVGPANEVLSLWQRLKDDWKPPREIRSNQPVLATSVRSQLMVDDQVRYSTSADLEILFPACVEMFTEEVGVSPMVPDGGISYRNRISELIGSRRSFVRTDDSGVVFKSEVGCVGASVAQLQGVWVNPSVRGQGIGRHGLAAVIKYVLDDIAPVVSLYANDYNKSAIAMYEKVGFRHIDSFATVLF